MGHLLSWDRMHSAAQKRQTHMWLIPFCFWGWEEGKKEVRGVVSRQLLNKSTN
jgi:hypothetical protein